MFPKIGKRKAEELKQRKKVPAGGAHISEASGISSSTAHARGNTRRFQATEGEWRYQVVKRMKADTRADFGSSPIRRAAAKRFD